jgi:toxoflavin biosynthesis protein ToxD
MANAPIKKNTKLQKKKNNVKKSSRFFPVILASFICTLLAISSGYGTWYFFGVKAKGQENREKLIANLTSVFSKDKTEIKSIETEKQPEDVSQVIATPTPATIVAATPQLTSIPENSETENKQETSESKLPITEGVVFVKGGETITGGGKTEKPLKRIMVDDFYIAETEVTNKQYAEFVADTKQKTPFGWDKKGYQKGLDDFPVTNISYNDAESFCKWLAKKIGAEVRLPNEVEWERAAKGEENLVYPWGNEWEKNCATLNGKVGKVKSFEKNKSPFGVYDMSGNVWELTADVELNSNQKPVYTNGQLNRIVRGGSALEEKKEFLMTSRWDTVSDSGVKRDNIGFRYIVLKSN